MRTVIAEGYERIHRSNLIGMGILPMQFLPGDSVQSLGLTGEETFDVIGLAEAVRSRFASGKALRVRAAASDGRSTEFEVVVRIDTPQELLYYRHGGILQYALRQLLSGSEPPEPRAPGLAGSPKPAPDQPPSDRLVEQSSIESFPASDPPAY